MVAEASLIELTGIAKQFGAVNALDGVDLRIGVGETIGLCGHNGAGKSTLMNILSGAMPADAGTIRVAGTDVSAEYDVGRSHALGIRCVFQEFSLCPNLRVFENVRVTHSALQGFGWRNRARKLASDKLNAIFPHSGIDVERPVGELSIAERQMVEIARAFTVTETPVRLVILDEPTSSLDSTATEQLMRYVAAARRQGVATILISHRLDEILENAGRAVVMRDGHIVGEGQASQLSHEQLVEMMGVVSEAAELHEVSPAVRAPDRPIRVAIRPNEIQKFDFVVRTGDIVGLAGLGGHGQRDLLQRIFAASHTANRSSDIRVDGTIAYVSGDRQLEGIFPLWSVGENTTIGLLKRLTRRGLIALRREMALAEDWCTKISIRTPSVSEPILSLSGGNQQKVLVARAFATEADIVLFDDPLRGVDIGTKRELYEHVRRQAAENGRCFAWYTTENHELVNCDRVYVFYRGQITDEIERAELTEERVIRSSFQSSSATGSEAAQAQRPIAAGLREEHLSVLLPALALILMLAATFLLQPRAMSYLGLRLLFNFAIPLIFAAMAQLCIIAASDIDLGLGSYISLVNCITAQFLAESPLIGGGLLLLCIVGYVAMGALVHSRNLPSIVVTLGASFVWLGFALLILPTPGGTAPQWLNSVLHWQPPYVPLPILLAVVTAIVCHLLLMRTSYAVVLRGLGGNIKSIERAGWSLVVARMTLYGAAGVLGVFAGLALTGLNTTGDANVGGQYTLNSIAAVIIGGGEFFGGVVFPIGAVIGSLILLLAGSLLLFLNVSTDWQLAVQGVILILVLGLRRSIRRKEQ